MDINVRDIKTSTGLDTNGEGIAVSIFFSGCSAEPKCEKCHNPELWESIKSDEIDTLPIHRYMEYITSDDFISHVVFLGGEPLDQPEPLLELATKAKDIGLTTWLYTGHEYSNVQKDIQELMDVIVAGKYDDSLATGGFPGSSNQEVVRKNPRINK